MRTLSGKERDMRKTGFGSIWLALALVACGSATERTTDDGDCGQGDTRACLGPGACDGAQVCGADGVWGSCDCGTSDGGAGGQNAATGGDPGQVNPEGCPADLVRCDGECTDNDTDPAHCGACHAACGTGYVCEGGACVCAPGLTECDDVCVNTLTSGDHCGECGTECIAGEEVCVVGACVCPEGLTLCSNSTDRCADLRTSAVNCGQCYSYCGDGSCVDGHCVAP